MEKEVKNEKNILRERRRKTRLAVIAILAFLIVLGFALIAVLAIKQDASVRQQTITALAAIVSAILGSLATVVKFYFDGKE